MGGLNSPLFLLAAFMSTAPSQPLVASPPSTLLPPNTTTLSLELSTLAPTACRWDTSNVPFPLMANVFDGEGTQHTTTLTGLSGDLRVSAFYVNCAAYAAAPPLVLACE
jgi:hypothetical protein